MATQENESPDKLTPKKKRRQRQGKLRMVLDHPQHGRIEIRHMSDEAVEGGRLIEYPGLVELSAIGEGTGGVWIQIAKTGEFKGHSAGPFELSEPVFSDIVRNFNATQNRSIPVDFEHATEADASEGSIPVVGAPAHGWIKALDNRGADGLWALVEWDDIARQYIKAGNYRYISPAIRFGSRDRVTGKPIGARLTSAGLTNQPFLDGMLPLVAKDYDDTSHDVVVNVADRVSTSEIVTKLLDWVDSETATPPSVPVPPADTDAGADTMESNTMSETTALKDLESRNGELTVKLSAADAKVALLEGELRQLRDSEAKRLEKDQTDRVNAAFLAYKETKKLNDADKSVMLTLCKADSAGFDQMFPPVAPQQVYLTQRLTEGNDAPPASSSDDDSPDLIKMADKIQKKNPGMDRGEALVAADIKIRARKAAR